MVPRELPDRVGPMMVELATYSTLRLTTAIWEVGLSHRQAHTTVVGPIFDMCDLNQVTHPCQTF